MGNGVEKVIDPNAQAEIGVTLGIGGVIRQFPGISDIGVETDGDHDATLVIIDRTPVSALAIARPLRIIRNFVAEPQMRGPGDLISLVEIVRSEEHTSELQSLTNLVFRLLLE